MRVSQVYSHYHYNVHSRDKELQVLIFRRLSQEFKQFEKTGRNNKKLIIFASYLSDLGSVSLLFRASESSPERRFSDTHFFLV